MSICLERVIMWLIMAGVSIAAGVGMDIALKTEAFPLFWRVVGAIGILLAHFPLKRTGRLLRGVGDPKQWGCTNRLVTSDIYQCVRHPHHLGVGVFMTSLGLVIGHLWSFLFITISQWVWVMAFLFLVEEKELKEKFGPEYDAYRKKVPMLLPKPACLLKVFVSRRPASSMPDGPDGA